MTGLPLNLFQYPSFAQLLNILVGEDDSDDGIIATTRRPTELDIGPPGRRRTSRELKRGPSHPQQERAGQLLLTGSQETDRAQPRT